MMIFALQVQHFFPFSKPRRKTESTGGEGRGQARGRGNTWCWAPWLQAWWPLVREKQWCPALWPAQGIIFSGDRHEKKV